MPVSGLAAPSEEAPTAETAAAAIEMDGDNAGSGKSERGELSAGTEEDHKVDFAQSEDGLEEDKSSVETEGDRGEAVAVPTQEGQQPAAVENSLQHEQLEGLPHEPLAVIGEFERFQVLQDSKTYDCFGAQNASRKIKLGHALFEILRPGPSRDVLK